MPKIFILSLMLCLSTTAFAHGARSYSVGIDCHLVPTRKCQFSVSVAGQLTDGGYGLGRMLVTLNMHNIYVQNGLYEGRLQVREDKHVVAKRRVKIFVRNGRVSLARISAVEKWLRKIKVSGFSIVRWASKGLLESGAIPLRVSDLSLRQGSMEAILLYKHRKAATSNVFMRPAKGCWIDEQKCQKH